MSAEAANPSRRRVGRVLLGPRGAVDRNYGPIAFSASADLEAKHHTEFSKFILGARATMQRPRRGVVMFAVGGRSADRWALARLDARPLEIGFELFADVLVFSTMQLDEVGWALHQYFDGGDQDYNSSHADDGSLDVIGEFAPRVRIGPHGSTFAREFARTKSQVKVSVAPNVDEVDALASLWSSMPPRTRARRTFSSLHDVAWDNADGVSVAADLVLCGQQTKTPFSITHMGLSAPESLLRPWHSAIDRVDQRISEKLHVRASGVNPASIEPTEAVGAFRELLQSYSQKDQRAALAAAVEVGQELSAEGAMESQLALDLFQAVMQEFEASVPDEPESAARAIDWYWNAIGARLSAKLRSFPLRLAFSRQCFFMLSPATIGELSQALLSNDALLSKAAETLDQSALVDDRALAAFAGAAVDRLENEPRPELFEFAARLWTIAPSLRLESSAASGFARLASALVREGRMGDLSALVEAWSHDISAKRAAFEVFEPHVQTFAQSVDAYYGAGPMRMDLLRFCLAVHDVKRVAQRELDASC